VFRELDAEFGTFNLTGTAITLTYAAVNVIIDFSDFQFTLLDSRLYYDIKGDDFDFALPHNKFDFTVDE